MIHDDSLSHLATNLISERSLMSDGHGSQALDTEPSKGHISAERLRRSIIGNMHKWKIEQPSPHLSQLIMRLTRSRFRWRSICGRPILARPNAIKHALSVSVSARSSLSQGVQATCSRCNLGHGSHRRQDTLKMHRRLMRRLENGDQVIELLLQLGRPRRSGPLGLAPARGDHLLAILTEPIAPLTSAAIGPQHAFAFGAGAVGAALAVSRGADSPGPRGGSSWRGHLEWMGNEVRFKIESRWNRDEFGAT